MPYQELLIARSRYKARELTVEAARSEIKALRKALPSTTSDKDIRSAGYYVKVFNQLQDTQKAGESPEWGRVDAQEWIKTEMATLRGSGPGKGGPGPPIVDAERKINILESFVDLKTKRTKKKKKKKKKKKS